MDTPLFDRLQPIPAQPRDGRRRRLLIGAAAGVAIDLLGLRFGWFDSLGRVCLAFLPSYYLMILVHELGHLLAARAIGFHWREFSAGPLVVRREAKRIQWRFVPSRLTAGGQVQAVPDSPAALRRRFLILLAGGPIATALLFIVVFSLPRGPWATALGLANALGAATSWLPFYSGGYVTDAKAILLLSRPGPEGDLLTAMLHAIALDTQGILPRDWEPGAVAALQSAAGTPLAGAASVLLLAFAIDVGDPEAIIAGVERGLSQAAWAIPMHRRMLFETAAYEQAIHRHNPGRAAAWLEDARRVTGVVAEHDWDADSLGAIALASGNPAEARREFARALARLDRLPPGSGCVAASRNRLSNLLRIAAQQDSRTLPYVPFG